MSIRASIFLLPIPLIILVLPPIFISPLTFETYFEYQSYPLILLGAWLLLEGVFEMLFLSWMKKPAWYIFTLLAITLAVTIAGTSLGVQSTEASRWFALTMLAALPLLAVRTAEGRVVFKTLTSFVVFSVIGFLRFCATLDTLRHPALTLAIVFSLAVAALVAQKPLMTAAEQQSFSYRNEKVFFRFNSVLWGLLPTTCMIAVGNGMLPLIFLSILLSFIFLSRILQILKNIETDTGFLPHSYWRLGVAASWLEVVLLVGSALLSSQISRDIL